MASGKPAKPSATATPVDFSGMPEFARAIRGLAHVPKAEVDAAIAKEKQARKRSGKRKK